MATKTIKFDLQLKGIKVTNFDELQDNFSADILPIFQSGRLTKWLTSRELSAQAEAIAAIDKNSTELQQLAAICRVLELDDDEEVLQFLLDDRQAAQAAAVPAPTPAAIAKEADTGATDTFSSSGVDWSGQDMSNRQFVGEDLRNANLENTNFGGSDLSRADLSGANLKGANLEDTNLKGAKFVDASLIKANLSGACLSYANFSDADLTNSYLTRSKSIADENSESSEIWPFEIEEGKKQQQQQQQVQYQQLKQQQQQATSKLPSRRDSNPVQSTPLKKEFKESINFSNANLTNSNLNECSFYSANFSGANLTKASVVDAHLFNAKFIKADLSFANFDGTGFGEHALPKRSAAASFSVGRAFLRGLDSDPFDSVVDITDAKLTGVTGFNRPKGR